MAASTKELRIEIHEAGHAVIGVDEDQTFERAALIRDDNDVVERGMTHAPTVPSITRGNAKPDEILECAKLAREILAGMHVKWKLDPEATPGAKDDMKQLSDLTDTMFDDPNEASEWSLKINKEMSALIEARWDAIQTVADNLLQGEQSRADIEGNDGALCRASELDAPVVEDLSNLVARVV